MAAVQVGKLMKAFNHWSIFWPQILFFPHPKRGSGTQNSVLFPNFRRVQALIKAPKIFGFLTV